MAKARILAVDDQRYFRELIEGLLTGEGYEVQTASGGEEALHVLEREAFDVVITDLVMPGVDGTELVRRIKERTPHQDIIMVTGVVDVKTAVETMKQGATDYILKPFDRNTLARSLDGILQRRRLREEHARLVAENLEYMEVLSLYERSVGLFSTLSLEPLAERIIEGLCLETRAQGGVLWVAHDVGEPRMALISARGLIRVDKEPEELSVEHLGPDFGAMTEEGRAVVRPWRRPDGEADGKALYVPLRSAGSVIGVARLTDKLEGAEFEDRDRAAAEKFVSCGSIALANAMRFRALERRSFRDPTTKAYTHAYFEDVVRNEIQKANRFGRHFSLVRVDVGSLGDVRRTTSDQQIGRWLEGVVHEVGQALRSTDLLAVESERRFSVLLPETDSLGAVMLKQRIRSAIERSGVLDAMRPEQRAELTLASTTFPTDGTQLEALERVLEERLHQHRTSILHSLDIANQPFGAAIDALLVEAEPHSADLPGQIASFLLEEVCRRPRDRGLLVLNPGRELLPRVRESLAPLAGAQARTEVVVVADGDAAARGVSPVTWVSPDRVSSDCPFLLYYGEGPAYAIIAEKRRENGALPIFHTSDRTLVEHLAFRLQRDLGIPLGA